MMIYELNMGVDKFLNSVQDKIVALDKIETAYLICACPAKGMD